MITTSTPATDPAILAEQVAYYRKRAGEYDEWWFRKVFHEPGALERRLAALGLRSRIVHTPRYFIHGAVSR